MGEDGKMSIFVVSDIVLVGNEWKVCFRRDGDVIPRLSGRHGGIKRMKRTPSRRRPHSRRAPPK
jgi:hypothetical protein